MAALIRENEQLRNVAAAAIKLRRLGQLADQHQENLEKLWDENPHMTKSATASVMYQMAYDKALDAFDDAVVGACESGMDWAQDHKIEMKVVQLTPNPHQAKK
jgi:hypothetical protein